MSEKDDQDEILAELALPELVMPDFKSNIPGYVADGLNPKEKYMLEVTSIIAQKMDFALLAIQHNRQQQNRLANFVAVTYKRTNKYEKLILVLTSKWSVVFYLIAALYPIVSNKLIQRFWP